MPPVRDPIELSRQLVYFTAERTLAGWIRSALSLMALGFVIDRFDMVLSHPGSFRERPTPFSHALSTWGGSALVGMGVLMVVGAGLRYLLFALDYRRDGSTDTGHGLFLGVVFAFLLGAFGVALIIMLLEVTR